MVGTVRPISVAITKAKVGGGATLWQSSENLLNELPVALPVFF